MNVQAINRRLFLQATSATGISVGIGSASGGVCLGADETGDASTVVTGKDGRLLIHGRDIPVLETPPELLTQQVTPLDVLFVRNNQPMDGAATLASVKLDGWKIAIDGLVSKSIVIDAGKLAELKSVKHEMVLQCCGNGRAVFANSVKAKGTQWLRGGMGNVQVSGVRLADVLNKFGVEVQQQAAFVTAEGKDPPLREKDDFEHSLPVQDALEQSLLVTHMNGKPLPAAHGGPVRLMTPGYFGTMHVKWVSRLRFETGESENYNHIPRYRTPVNPIKPGAPVTYTLDNSKACWKMKVKSVILTPSDGGNVKTGESLLVSGVAFNDGSAPIETVLLSADKGRTWRPVKLEKADSPYAWRRWSAKVKLPLGRHELWSRAIDGWGRSQPLDGSIAWNPSGYEWNGVEKVAVDVT